MQNLEHLGLDLSKFVNLLKKLLDGSGLTIKQFSVIVENLNHLTKLHQLDISTGNN